MWVNRVYGSDYILNLLEQANLGYHLPYSDNALRPVMLACSVTGRLQRVRACPFAS